MKIILNEIKDIEKNKDDKNLENKSKIYILLNDCIKNNISIISDKDNHITILKDDFKNYLIQRKLIYL